MSIAFFGLSTTPHDVQVRLAVDLFAIPEECLNLAALRIRRKFPTVILFIKHAALLFAPFLVHYPLANDWCERANARVAGD